MAAEGEPLDRTLDLIGDAQHGDARALEQLFARYYPRVRQIVALRMGRRIASFVELDDVAQETLLRVFKGLDRFEATSESGFRNWIAVCVERAIADEARHVLAKKRGEGKARRFGDGVGSVRLSAILPGDGFTASQQVAEEELESKVEDALLALPPRQRELIVLRYFCGMSSAEICETLDIASTTAARKALSRALDALKKAVGPLE